MNDSNKIAVIIQNEEERIRLYLEERPHAGPMTIARHLGISVNTVTKTLKPNGFPKSWTKEIVEDILNNIVWKNAQGVTLKDLRHNRGVTNTPLWRAFIFYGFPASYPLENYRKKFHRMIYPLFGMEIPQSCEDEWEMEWPEEKTLRKRYRSLMRLHHPDRHQQDYIRAKVATINCQLIADAYQKILKRKKWLTMGDPPSIRSEEMAIHSKRKIN